MIVPQTTSNILCGPWVKLRSSPRSLWRSTTKSDFDIAWWFWWSTQWEWDVFDEDTPTLKSMKEQEENLWVLERNAIINHILCKWTTTHLFISSGSITIVSTYVWKFLCETFECVANLTLLIVSQPSCIRSNIDWDEIYSSTKSFGPPLWHLLKNKCRSFGLPQWCALFFYPQLSAHSNVLAFLIRCLNQITLANFYIYTHICIVYNWK